MPRHVMLLGDIKGTRSYLKAYIEGDRKALIDRLGLFYGIFARVILRYLPRSRSLHAYTFSDSCAGRWDDAEEGRRYCMPLATDLWRELSAAGLDTRIYVEEGESVPASIGIGESVGAVTGRMHHIFPVSQAGWAVFVAEESHFPSGVFFGEQIAVQFRKQGLLASEPLDAGDFRFFGMT